MIGAVLVLHFALLCVVDLASRTSAARSGAVLVAPSRVTLRLFAERHDTAVAPVVAAAPATARTAATSSGTPTLPRRPAMPSAPTAITEPTLDAALHAELPASAPEPTEGLLDTEASRRAIRASARLPSLNQQLARAREEPDRLGAQQRLVNGMMSAGKGDCLKGEFAGAGMGLLSLPFLGLAAVSGNCAK
ncbi:hypothetical protein [Rhizobacter fulvus]